MRERECEREREGDDRKPLVSSNEILRVKLWGPTKPFDLL